MNYLDSVGFQKDFNNLLKALLLISKRLEDITQEIRLARESLPESRKESTTD